MSKICSVPINYLIFRGQGIKLTSFIAKECRQNNTLMPVLQKKDNNNGYEGAIVLEPKCGLYLKNPVACVDYSSLYPSSMISENLCHSSKVWTKEFDLNNDLANVGIVNPQPCNADANTTFPFIGSKFHTLSSSSSTFSSCSSLCSS